MKKDLRDATLKDVDFRGSRKNFLDKAGRELRGICEELDGFWNDLERILDWIRMGSENWLIGSDKNPDGSGRDN